MHAREARPHGACGRSPAADLPGQATRTSLLPTVCAQALCALICSTQESVAAADLRHRSAVGSFWGDRRPSECRMQCRHVTLSNAREARLLHSPHAGRVICRRKQGVVGGAEAGAAAAPASPPVEEGPPARGGVASCSRGSLSRLQLGRRVQPKVGLRQLDSRAGLQPRHRILHAQPWVRDAQLEGRALGHGRRDVGGRQAAPAGRRPRQVLALQAQQLKALQRGASRCGRCRSRSRSYGWPRCSAGLWRSLLGQSHEDDAGRVVWQRLDVGGGGRGARPCGRGQMFGEASGGGFLLANRLRPATGCVRRPGDARRAEGGLCHMWRTLPEALASARPHRGARHSPSSIIRQSPTRRRKPGGPSRGPPMDVRRASLRPSWGAAEAPARSAGRGQRGEHAENKLGRAGIPACSTGGGGGLLASHASSPRRRSMPLRLFLAY